MEIIAFAMRCCKDPGGIKVDYEKLAEMGKFKTPASAATAWSVVRKKLLAGGPTAESSSSQAAQEESKAEISGDGVAGTTQDAKVENLNSVNTPKKKVTRKPKTAEPTDGDEVTTPKPKKRGPKAKQQTEDGEEVAAPKPKKRVTKPKLETDKNGDDITVPEGGEGATKPEAEADGVQPVIVTPSKKRGRKANDDPKPTTKKSKASGTDENEGGDDTIEPATIGSSKEGGDGKNVAMEGTEVGEGTEKAAPDGSTGAENASEGTEKGDGNEVEA
jgi:hypothetical protein